MLVLKLSYLFGGFVWKKQIETYFRSFNSLGPEMTKNDLIFKIVTKFCLSYVSKY